jgi:hypothetical protein
LARVHRLAGVAVILATLLAPEVARADDRAPDGALALVTGAVTVFAGFAVGGTLIATGTGNARPTEAGWLTIQAGFAAAPLTSHAVVGEWGRGAVFSALPTVAALCSAPVFASDGSAVDHESIWTERLMWWLVATGVVTGTVGVVDAAFAPGRSVHVAPVVGPGTAGLALGGTL